MPGIASIARSHRAAWLLGLGLLAASGPADETTPSPAGARLAAFLDSLEVEKHWLAGHHVHWKTGEPDGRRVPPAGVHSHCSAFVAAVCYRLGIPILEPPDHPQVLLASAQCAWLPEHGREVGWTPLTDALDAQRLANAGQLVVACFATADPDDPGHIAIVRPAAQSAQRIARHGPQIVQAGQENWNSASLERGFRHHPGAWTQRLVRFYAHAVPEVDDAAGR